jgi:hypothetical protein
MRRPAFLVTVLAATLAAAMPAAGQPASHPSIWSIVPSPSPGTDVFNADLEGISPLTASEAWAVGTDSNGGQSTGLAEHWDGMSWSVAPTPSVPGREPALHGVAALSATNAWAVGETTLDGGTETETLIEHWDGMGWSIVPSPNVATSPTSANTLQAISAVSANDIWATGWAIDPSGTTIEMLFEHWNGRTWKISTSPTPGGSFQFSTGITTISSSDAWAVGFDATFSPERTLAAHWDGHAWSIVPTPNLADGLPPDNKLVSVTATASNDVWAVGYELNLQQLNIQRPVVEHWDGSSWSIVRTPSPGSGGSELFGVTAVRPGDVWAVGESRSFDTGTQHSLTMQWNGSSWTRFRSPNGFLTTTPLAAASLPDGHVWGVGGTEHKGQCCLRTLVLATAAG